MGYPRGRCGGGWWGGAGGVGLLLRVRESFKVLVVGGVYVVPG